MLSDLTNLSSYDARLQFAAELLDKTVHIGTDNIILIAKRFHNKLLLAEKYRKKYNVKQHYFVFKQEVNIVKQWERIMDYQR
jgi:hypothetical protein